DRRAERGIGGKLALQPLDLLLDRNLEQPAGEPAGNQLEAVPLQNGAEHHRIHRELAAGLGAAEAGEPALRQAGLQRRIAAELRQVVVRPGDWRDAEPDAARLRHAPTRCLSKAPFVLSLLITCPR